MSVHTSVCGRPSLSLFRCVFARVYLSLCACVFLGRSSAGGDHGGAGEERRQHAGPHYLRRNRQGRQTSSIEPATRRTGGQVGADIREEEEEEEKLLHSDFLY